MGGAGFNLLHSLKQTEIPMTAAARSLYYFGFYLMLTGVTLTVAPNLLLSLFGIPTTTEVWIRVLGNVVFTLGLGYVVVAPSNLRLFLVYSVYARAFVFVMFGVFVALDIAPWQLILFGVVDLAGAAWTYSGLRRE
jgi:hypothetical protein